MPIKDPVKRRENHARYMREVWYPKNKAKHIAFVHAYDEQRAAERRQFINEHKTKCCYCGETEKVCLDFHHKDSALKDDNIAAVGRLGWSLKRIQKEIDKCIVVCANCHRKIHAGLYQGMPVQSNSHKVCPVGATPTPGTIST